ncbi:hypothetical protein JCM10449v2_006709 [Rhodotorula kratochvilovae]
MPPAFFRKRRQPSADQQAPPPASAPPPSSAAPAPAHAPPAVAAPPEEPPRSYAQLADLADEIVASSWDASLPLQTWLNGVRQIAIEGDVYRNEGNHDMAFVRMATVLKLLREVLPYHHPEWRTVSQAQLASVQKQIASASSIYASLKSHLIARTTAFYASSSSFRPSPAASGSSPALLLSNTVTIAATVYRDGPAQPSAPAGLDALPSTQPRRAPAGALPATAPAPPRANRLRAAFGMSRQGSSSPASVASAGALPEPGALLDEGDDAALARVGSASSPAEDLLLTREMGRRIPKLGEAVAPPPGAASSAAAAGRGAGGYSAAAYGGAQYAPSTPSVGGGPMPLPGEGDSDESDEDGEGGGIAYAQGGGLAPARTPAWSDVGRQATGWPPASQAQVQGGPAPQAQYPSAAYPGYPYPPSTASAASSLHSVYTAAPVHPAYLPVQHPYAQQQPSPYLQPHPPTQPAPHPHAYPSPPAHPAHPGAQPSYFPPGASLRPPVPPAQPVPPAPPLPPAPPAHSAAPAPPQPPQPTAPPSHLHSHALACAPPATPTPPHFSPPTVSSTISSHPVSVPRPSAPSPAPSSPSPALGGAGLGRARSLSLSMAGLALGGRERETESEAEAGTGAVARTESGAPLRGVVLPARLISHFMHAIAAANTARRVETCGLLLGVLRSGTFHVTHLLIPKQEGTADTCAATHEEETFAFQEERGLMTLGWIHTHPTQSIFLSSLDLHTHAGYQLMLAEAVAVVCAPSAADDEPQYGVFRMTDPPGVQAVIQCREEGAFHPHPPLPLYTDVDEEGGHCRVEDDAPFECVDLR